jgi:hypothetical protein
LKSICALAGLIAAMAAVANIPDQVLKADRNRGERHEPVSWSAIAGLPTFTGQALALDVREIEQTIADEWAQAHGRYVGARAPMKHGHPT